MPIIAALAAELPSLPAVLCYFLITEAFGRRPEWFAQLDAPGGLALAGSAAVSAVSAIRLQSRHK